MKAKPVGAAVLLENGTHTRHLIRAARESLDAASVQPRPEPRSRACAGAPADKWLEPWTDLIDESVADMSIVAAE